MTAATARPDDSIRAEWIRGWPTLAGAFVGVGTTWIFFQLAAGLFIVPMQAEFGWSRTQLSIASWGGLGAGLLLPFAGLLIDRIGSRQVAIVGMVLLGVGLIGLSLLPPHRGVLWLLIVFLCATGALSNSVIFARGIATWFRRSFGSATGLMMSGPSLAAAIGIPILSAVIAAHGWRAGYLAMAAWVGVLGLPVVLLLFRERQTSTSAVTAGPGQGKPPGATLRTVARSRNFVLLALATAIAALPIGGYLSHLQPILSGLGEPREVAARYGSLFALAIGGGRLVLGPLLDRFHAPFVTGVSLGLATLGAGIFAALHTPAPAMLGTAIVLIGLAQGAEADYLKFFASRLFGLTLFGRVASVMSMLASAGMGLGGFLFASVFDRTGNYAGALSLSVVLYAIAGLLFAMIRMDRIHDDQ